VSFCTWSAPVSLVKFQWNLNFRDRFFKKYSNMNFFFFWMSFRWEPRRSVWTNRRTVGQTDMTKLIVASFNAANTPTYINDVLVITIRLAKLCFWRWPASNDSFFCFSAASDHLCEFDIYWTVHHCDNWRIKTQLVATYYFIVLLIGSTCFGHHYAHHQELTTIVLITALVVSVLVCCMLGG